jgi:hypothetical protein
MSKYEGKIYEDIAILWFNARKFTILKHQFAKGIDFLVRSPEGQELWYEIKGKQLIDIYRDRLSFRITGVKISNIEIDPIQYYLFIIYDNFTDVFRFLEIHRDIINEIRLGKTGSSSYISFYELFEKLGIDKILYNVNDVDITKRKF